MAKTERKNVSAQDFIVSVQEHDGDVPAIAAELGVKEQTVRLRHAGLIKRAKDAGVDFPLTPLKTNGVGGKKLDMLALAKLVNPKTD